MTASAYIAVILNGILVGGVYGLFSSAFTFQSGALKFANFSYGACLMVSMYLTYASTQEWGFPVPVAVIFVLLCNVLMGFVLRKTVLRSNNFGTQILCTMGVSMILVNVVTFFFTSYPRDLAIFEHRIQLTDRISLGSIQLVCFVLAGVVLLGFHVFLNRTWPGKAIRAVVQNSDIAATMGINTRRTMDMAFSLSYMLIGVSGMMLMVMNSARPDIGNYFQTLAFIICVSAGIGNMGGAFFSGIFVGVLSALITTVLGAQFHDPLLFGLFVVLLLIRPYGIFSSRKKVASSI